MRPVVRFASKPEVSRSCQRLLERKGELGRNARGPSNDVVDVLQRRAGTARELGLSEITILENIGECLARWAQDVGCEGGEGHGGISVVVDDLKQANGVDSGPVGQIGVVLTRLGDEPMTAAHRDGDLPISIS